MTLVFSVSHKGKNSPSSPAVRDLLDRHQASLGRSQSFSHQQPSRSHIMRYVMQTPPWFRLPVYCIFQFKVLIQKIFTYKLGSRIDINTFLIRTGSAMERRAITPPVGSPVGRPLYLPPQDKSLLSLDKIAKRECKVLVVDPVS